MHYNIISLALFFIFNSCHFFKQELPTKENDTWLLNSEKVFFSNLKSKDNFILKLTGSSIRNATGTFIIINSNSDTLFYEEFNSIDLVGYGLSGADTTSFAIEEYISKRVSTFFDSKNFMSPALNTNSKFDSDEADSLSWFSVKEDTESVSFYFLIGEENMRAIAFSKKLGKVVVIHSCC